MSAKIGRLLSHDECYYVYKCRIMLAHLTGEPFECGWAPWCTFAGIPVELECFCPRLKLALIFTGGKYQVPVEYSSMYNDISTMRKFIRDGISISAGKAGFLVIDLPMVPDEEIKDTMSKLYAQFIQISGIPYAGGVRLV